MHNTKLPDAYLPIFDDKVEYLTSSLTNLRQNTHKLFKNNDVMKVEITSGNSMVTIKL